MYILYLYINNRIIILNIQKKPHLVMNEKYSPQLRNRRAIRLP